MRFRVSIYYAPVLINVDFADVGVCLNMGMAMMGTGSVVCEIEQGEKIAREVQYITHLEVQP